MEIMILVHILLLCIFFFQAEDGIRDLTVTGVQTCALPIFTIDTTPPALTASGAVSGWTSSTSDTIAVRSEEHTSELQSQSNLVCRLLLEKKKQNLRNKCTNV